MVTEVITASRVYLWLLSPRRLIPGVEASGWKTARSHFEDELQQLTPPVHCSFPPFFILYHFPCIPHAFTFIFFIFYILRLGGLNTLF